MIRFSGITCNGKGGCRNTIYITYKTSVSDFGENKHKHQCPLLFKIKNLYIFPLSISAHPLSCEAHLSSLKRFFVLNDAHLSSLKSHLSFCEANYYVNVPAGFT